jgi:hypothetical protein
VERCSIRCRLDNIRPLRGVKRWRKEEIDIIKGFVTDDRQIKIKIQIKSCDDFKDAKIYGVDIFFQDESLIDYFLSQNLAIKVKQNKKKTKKQLNLTQFNLNFYLTFFTLKEQF